MKIVYFDAASTLLSKYHYEINEKIRGSVSLLESVFISCNTGYENTIISKDLYAFQFGTD